MESKFKAGDKVKVIEDLSPSLKEGDVYTVDYTEFLYGNWFVHFVGHESWQGWYEYRFELVEDYPGLEQVVDDSLLSAAPQIEFKYNNKVYQGVVKEGCKGCAFDEKDGDCMRSNNASKEQTGTYCYTHDMIWVEKKPEQPKVNEQIIHCHNHRSGVYGSTWVFTESAKGQKYVDVQYALCHPKDQYVKKTGVQLAKSKPKVTILKGKVPDYVWVDVYGSTYKFVNYPGMKQIYQAIVHLTK